MQIFKTKRFSCSSSFYVSFSFFNNADIRKRWRIKVKINHGLINSKIVRDRYTIKAALAIVISIATSESVWNCVTCSPLVRLCVTIRLFRHSFSRGQRLIVQRSLGISCVREAAERCSLAERGRVSHSLSHSLVLLQQSLSAVKIVVRRKRGRKGEGSDKQSGDEQEGLARVNHTLLHRRQKTLSRRQLDVLLSQSPVFRNFAKPRSGGGMRHRGHFSCFDGIDCQSISQISNSFFPR